MDQTRTESKKRLAPLPSAAAALAVLFFAIYTVSTEVVFYRYAVVVVFFLLAFLMTRSKLVTALAGFACVCALLSSASEGSSALFLAVIGMIGFGGLAVAFAHPLWWLVPVLCAGGVSLLLTGELLSLVPILGLALVMIALGIGLGRGFTRTGTLTLVCAVALAVIAAAALLFIFVREGGIPNGYLTSFIEECRTTLVDKALAIFESYRDDPAFETFSGLFTREVLTALVNTVIRLLPAILVIVIETVAYFSGLLALMTCGNLMPKDTLARHSIEFRVTTATAVIFLVSCVLTLLLSGFDSGTALGVLTVSVTTLHLILLPGLGICGLLFAIAFVRTRMRPGPFTLILLAGLLFFSPMYSLYVLAVIGAVAIVVAEYKKKKDNTL